MNSNENRPLKFLSLTRFGGDRLVKTTWIILTALYVYQLTLIYWYSVDIPFKDDWVYLWLGHPLCLPESLSFNWLFARISEHCIVMTNLLTWLNFKLFGLDFFKQKIINFLIFSLILLALVRFKNRIIGCDNFRMFPAFLFFMLSPIAVENHTWAFQSQIHLVLLFFVVMLIYMKSEPVSGVETFIFISSAILAIYSFAAGIILALICLVFRNLHLVVLIVTHKITRKAGLLNLVTCTIVIGGTIALWSAGYEKPEYIPAGTWPTDPIFWSYYLNMLSFGFGVDTQNLLLGVFSLLLSLLPLICLQFDKAKRIGSDVICVSAAIIAILTVLASIAFGRAGIGDAKTSRYVEISFMLIPFTSMAWWLLLKNSPVKNLVLSLLWTACFCSYLDNWAPNLYLEVYRSDKSTLDCVSNYFRFGGDAACQEFWITPDRLEKAKQLKINFTRKMLSPIQH